MDALATTKIVLYFAANDTRRLFSILTSQEGAGMDGTVFAIDPDDLEATKLGK